MLTKEAMQELDERYALEHRVRAEVQAAIAAEPMDRETLERYAPLCFDAWCESPGCGCAYCMARRALAGEPEPWACYNLPRTGGNGNPMNMVATTQLIFPPGRV